MRTPSIAALWIVVGCGPASPIDDVSDTGTTAPADSSTTDTESSSTSLTGTGDATSDADTSGESSSTGDPFTFSADEALWEMRCDEELGPGLWVEIYPGLLDEQCAPPPGVDDEFVLLLLQPWDGQGGTFVIDDDSTSRAAYGMEIGPTIGEVTLEVSAPWTPASVTIDLATPRASISGAADLSVCGLTEPADPCG